MRIRLFYIIPLLVLAGACAPEELDNPWVGPTCTDGIQNQDEEDIDCGGRCTACEVFIPVLSPCTKELKDNTLTIEGRKIAVSDIRQCAENSAGYYTIDILMDGKNRFIIQFAAKPTKSATYIISAGLFNISTEEVVMQYEEPGYDYPFTTYGSTLYVSVAKDKSISAEFCNVTLGSSDYWGYETYQRTVSGRISGCPQ